jgi:hypothetical protein
MVTLPPSTHSDKAQSEGRSSVAAAAYRLALRWKILAPACAMISAARVACLASLTLRPRQRPAWASDPAQLWANETIEKRKDAQLREFDIALPRELTPQQCATLARAFVQKGSLTGACVQRLLLSITSVVQPPIPPDDHDARH